MKETPRPLSFQPSAAAGKTQG